VATRTCLDLADARGKRAMPMDLGPSSDRAVIQGNAPLTDVAWLSPYPDTGVGQGSASPEARYEQREAVELAFVAALQHLSGNQRAALLLFDVLGFSAAEIAEAMQTSATSVNSALARARRTIQEKVPALSQQQALRTIGDTRLQELVTGFAAALESGDPDALVALLTEDVTWSMPPLPYWYHGLAAVTEFAVEVPMTRCPSWRYLTTSANGQPAVAFYLGAQASGPHLAWSITVLTLRDTRIAEITSFLEPNYFTAFGLPAALA
jgi:RNA polymerase sigma-70 factor (ECF subfamily)